MVTYTYFFKLNTAFTLAVDPPLIISSLDTTTQLISRPSPEGIPYTGSCDGLIIAEDLNISMRQRVRKHNTIRRSSTGWGNEIVYDALDEDKDM